MKRKMAAAVMLVLIAGMCGCNGPRLVSGIYVLRMSAPKPKINITASAAVAVFENDVDVATVGGAGPVLTTTEGRMRWGGLRLRLAQSSGSMAAVFELKGKVHSAGSAGGTFVHYVNGRKVNKGDWHLTHGRGRGG